MTPPRADVGEGLAPARPPRPIEPGESIHVVGVAGAGASAAALLALDAGADVSGCDPGAPSPYTLALEARSVPVVRGHDEAHVLEQAGRPGRLAVTKALTAIDPHHPELEAARAAGWPVEPWQQVVADAAASHGGRLVAVAGTHGKSTSAGWLVHVLAEAGRDPGAFVGALLPPVAATPAATARWGRGDVFVLEADEYAGNFDPYRPSLAIVLNAEWDHPDVFADRDAVVKAFDGWLRSDAALDRRVVVGVDDAGAAELAARLADWGDRVISVSRSSHLDKRGVSYSLDEGLLQVDLTVLGMPDVIEARLQLAGAHNAANAACVAAAAAMLGVPPGPIATGLGSFEGVGRRFELKGEVAGVVVIDDYGHHPTAIAVTVAAARERYPGRRVWVAHEPLTFHRAAAMVEELADALASADEVVVADIWAGRDRDTSVISAAELARAVSERSGREVMAPGSPESTADLLAQRVERGDVVVTMGGGRSYVIADRLVELLAERDAE